MKWQWPFFSWSSVWLVCFCLSGAPSGSTIREQREASYKKERRNPYLKYQWASVAPCSTALHLYKEITDSVSAPESLRAFSFGALGEYYYTIGEFRKAAELFESASKLSENPRFHHFQVLALLQTDDWNAVHSLLDKISQEKNKKDSIVANFYRGLVHLKQGDFAAAHTSFAKCDPPDTLLPLTIESLSAKLFCSMKLGRTEEAQRYREQLKKYSSAAFIDWSSETPGKNVIDAAVPQGAAVSESVSNESFTVQVGAFSSKDNAYALQKKLADTFRDITVATVSLDDKVFYRVRIGNFTSRELAERFAADSVQKAGFNAKVIPQYSDSGAQ